METSSDSYLDLGRLGKSSWWRYLSGSFIVCAIYLTVGAIAYEGTVRLLAGGKPVERNPSTQQLIGIDPMIDYTGLHVSFLILLATLVLVVKFVHNRSFHSLITPLQRIDWAKVRFGFVAWAALDALSCLIGSILFPGSYKLSLQFPRFVMCLPLILVLTPMQAMTEELLFRGYFLQAFSFVKIPFVLATINGVLFLLPHLLNPEIASDPALMGMYYFVMGFLMTLVTIKTNSLEMAIGAHTVNNLWALIVNYENSALTVPSIWICSHLRPSYELSSLIILGVLFYVFASRWMSKRRIHSLESS